MVNNDIYKNVLLALKDEDSILEEINKYWQHFWHDQERKRYSPMSKGAFDTLKAICKYHLLQKRDGSVVNQIRLDNGNIITEREEVSSTLIQVLAEI